MAGCVGHMAAPGDAPMLDIAVFIPWAARNRRLALLITVRRRQQSAHRRSEGTTELCLNGLAQVLQNMDAVAVCAPVKTPTAQKKFGRRRSRRIDTRLLGYRHIDGHDVLDFIGAWLAAGFSCLLNRKLDPYAAVDDRRLRERHEVGGGRRAARRTVWRHRSKQLPVA
jgi:hypothetical protein